MARTDRFSLAVITSGRVFALPFFERGHPLVASTGSRGVQPCIFPLRLQPQLDQASRPPNIAGFRPSIAGGADFVNKSIALLEAIRRNAGVLQRSDVQKHIRAPGVILDKAETALNIPHL
jgi:hypothetical protein